MRGIHQLEAVLPVHSVILAAGQGTRMKSARPKVLQSLAGQSLLQHVIAGQARPVSDQIHVVYGHGGEMVRDAFADQPDLSWALQAEQLGTGHALAHALPAIEDDATVLVLYGDVPLVPADTLQELVARAAQGNLLILTVDAVDPTGYGRIVRDSAGQVQRIVEHKDANEQQLRITEVNTGILACEAGCLRAWVQALSSDNAQGEYYLTDCIAAAVADGVEVHAIKAASEADVAGVNNRQQLAALEREFQRRQADAAMASGLHLMDPARFDLRGSLDFGRDCQIDINVVLEGRVSLGDNVKIGANCILKDVVIGSATRIEPNSVLESATLAEDCVVGPFARLRPGTQLAAKAKVGNFVETKKTQVGKGSKINHLSYVGDATLGRDVNVGAGTITCNYDGVNKFQTHIEDGAFIGSDSALVAPVRIGAGATIGAGSVITEDAPANKLSLARGRQATIDNWQRPEKKS